jgi:hypothetical protein
MWIEIPILATECGCVLNLNCLLLFNWFEFSDMNIQLYLNILAYDKAVF